MGSVLEFLGIKYFPHLRHIYEIPHEHRFEETQESEEFYAISDNDDLFLKSKKTVKLLLNELESVEHYEELANFYLQYSNTIDDRSQSK